MTWTFPPHLLDETRRVAAKDFAVRLATMTRAEVVKLHGATCARVEKAIREGREMWPTTLDEVSALQERRDSLKELPPADLPSPIRTVTHIDGARLRYPLRCF